MFNAKHNQIESASIAPALFELNELTTIDLSHNKLTDLPAHIANAKGLIVLSLAHNEIASIRSDLLSSVSLLSHKSTDNLSDDDR